jgi:hypothetical protein
LIEVIARISTFIQICPLSWLDNSFYLIEKALKSGIWRSPDPQIRAGDLRIPCSSNVPSVKRFSISKENAP